MEPSEIERALRENATGAQSVSSAAGSASSHSLESQIKAADREAAIRARRRGGTGLTSFRIVGNDNRS